MKEIEDLILKLGLTTEEVLTMLRGFAGEKKIRDWFKKKDIRFMQVDIMFKSKGVWCLGEIKAQEKFISPPFDGHGLPDWQVKRRIEFKNDTGIKPYLIVYDTEDECMYIENLEVLCNGEKHQTNGKKPRLIFNINSFKKFVF